MQREPVMASEMPLTLKWLSDRKGWIYCSERVALKLRTYGSMPSEYSLSANMGNQSIGKRRMEKITQELAGALSPERNGMID
jgi:hypothetical protein